MYLFNAIYLILVVLPPPPPYLKFGTEFMNVEIFVTLGYLANKFVVLCHSYLQSQTFWSKTASVGGDYNQFALFYILSPTTEVEACS